MFERYHAELLNFLTRQLSDRHAAADLAQESYARMLTAYPVPGSTLDVRALLYRVARNLLVDRHRRNMYRSHEDLHALTEADQPAAPRTQEPEEALASRQRVDAYLGVIDALPPRCREAFVMHVFDEISHAQIAQRMGISASMVEKHVARGLLACRQCEQELGDTGT